MLTEGQKRLLENQLYKLIKESVFENGYFEGEDTPKHTEHHEDSSSSDIEGKEDAVLDWLDDHKEKKSVLAYELWPEKDKDTARSQFSKKSNGEDADGKAYHFQDDEVNDLYNMIGSKIRKSEWN